MMFSSSSEHRSLVGTRSHARTWVEGHSCWSSACWASPAALPARSSRCPHFPPSLDHLRGFWHTDYERTLTTSLLLFQTQHHFTIFTCIYNFAFVFRFTPKLRQYTMICRPALSLSSIPLRHFDKPPTPTTIQSGPTDRHTSSPFARDPVLPFTVSANRTTNESRNRPRPVPAPVARLASVCTPRRCSSRRRCSRRCPWWTRRWKAKDRPAQAQDRRRARRRDERESTPLKGASVWIGQCG